MYSRRLLLHEMITMAIMVNGTLLDAYYKYTNFSEESLITYIWSSLPIRSTIPMEAAIMLFSAIFLLSVIGNSIVIVVVVKVEGMKNRMNVLLANLSIGSLGVTTLCMPFFAAEYLLASNWIFGGFFCKGLHTMENIFTIGCILTVGAISYERYLGICFPMNLYTRWRATSMKIVIPCIWCMSVLTSIPTLFCVRETVLKMSTFKVTICNLKTDVIIRKFYHGFYSSLFVVTFLSSVYLITRMVFRLCQGKSKSRKVITVLLLMTTIHLCFLLPHRVLLVFFTFLPQETSRLFGYRSCFILYECFRFGAFLNFALNPFIYNFVSSKFKKAFKQLFLKRGFLQIYDLVRRRRRTHEDIISLKRMNAIDGTICVTSV